MAKELGTFLDNIGREVSRMAKKRRGGTIVFNVKRRPSEDFVLKDLMRYSNLIRPPIPFSLGFLYELFDTRKPGHDGAAVIELFDQNYAAFFPQVVATEVLFSLQPEFTVSFLPGRGTRHNSGLLLSMLTNSPVSNATCFWG